MTLESLDINADLGEGYGNWRIGRDDELMKLITTANVACGFHASDPVIMAETVRLAHGLGVAIGAHPGLPDLLGFGRRRIGVTSDEARAYVLYQVGALQAFLDATGATLHHVKPHGALYWMINEDAELAATVMSAISEVHPRGTYYWPAPIPAAVRRAAERAELRLVPEFYVDTRYDGDAALILERKKVPVDIPQAVTLAQQFVHDGYMEAVSGRRPAFEAESLCIHGDGPNAVELARSVRDSLSADGLEFRAVAA